MAVHGTIKRLLIYSIAGTVAAGACSCTHYEKNASHRNVPDENIKKGKQLAADYCQSCHLLPDPSLLDAKHWETGVLPGMGPRLGIFDYGFIHYPNSRNDPNVDKNYYPSKPMLGTQNWQYIIDYYTSLSPDSLPGQDRKTAVKSGLSMFTVVPAIFKEPLPTTCFVQVDTLAAKRQVVISDMKSKQLIMLSAGGAVLDSFSVAGTVVDLDHQPGKLVACNIGLINPNNGKYGTIGTIGFNALGKMELDSSLRINGLERPVQVTAADFNRDGKMDYLVCEFGNLAGALSWLENKGDGHFERHVIRGVAGPIKAYISDVNHDGLPDVWALFTQGDEGIFLFTNQGNGTFRTETILRFQSIAGSSYFEFADFNKDGYPDILYTCGDNADYSPVLKPYHGVYIYLNDKTNHFKQSYFFPMYGAFKAMARDFDGDGDLDIAAISFFADYTNHPDETFIYLENKGNLDFQPYSVPGTDQGRWLTMDAGDVDGDGRTDLVLGNFSIAPAFLKGAANWKNGPPYIVLKNGGKK